MRKRYPLTDLWQDHDQLMERRNATLALMEILMADTKLLDRRLDEVQRDIEREGGAA